MGTLALGGAFTSIASGFHLLHSTSPHFYRSSLETLEFSCRNSQSGEQQFVAVVIGSDFTLNVALSREAVRDDPITASMENLAAS